MTKEEREQRRIIAAQDKVFQENQRMAKELSKEEYRQRARFKALETAQYLKPPVNYINDRSGLAPQQTVKVQPDYDVVAAAEKIYQWLIKVLK